MMRKARKVSMESSPSSSSLPIGTEEARARFKHQCLLQDYQDLLMETEAKKKKLQKAVQKKLKLLAEVKFLRRKHKSFLTNRTQQTPCRLKKQSHKMQPPSLRAAQPQNPVNQSEIPSKDRIQRVKEAGIPSTSAVLDLNQNAEETEEFQVEWGPLNVDKLKRCSMEGDAGANDLKLSIFRDSGNGSGRVGKRKITWQDQVALKV